MNRLPPLKLVVVSLCFSSSLLGCATAGQDENSPEPAQKSDAKQDQQPASDPAEDPAEDPPAPAQPAADPSTLTVTGTLTYTELPRTKSVEAYLGKEFTLVDAKGTEHNLKSSDTVSHEELVGRSGHTVTVTCTPYPERQPQPHEQAPMGAPGQGTMPRPAGCTVTALATAP
ncbi:hypothetical protein DB30_07738 [Enhygromyxa salina]|uniref:Secreted protein n=1 Tax=Enhygromyxa salina TaxID=215803 RepID=A0A0C2A5R7_9BACT|nr:hypothetical protein [Enhygromyxa salina]KIG18723.1 hypothetical protein DB30_07738 [Enhygromyxa salina]